MLKTGDMRTVILGVAAVMIAGGLMYALRNVDIIDKARRGFDV